MWRLLCVWQLSCGKARVLTTQGLCLDGVGSRCLSQSSTYRIPYTVLLLHWNQILPPLLTGDTLTSKPSQLCVAEVHVPVQREKDGTTEYVCPSLLPVNVKLTNPRILPGRSWDCIRSPRTLKGASYSVEGAMGNVAVRDALVDPRLGAPWPAAGVPHTCKHLRLDDHGLRQRDSWYSQPLIDVSPCHVLEAQQHSEMLLVDAKNFCTATTHMPEFMDRRATRLSQASCHAMDLAEVRPCVAFTVLPNLTSCSLMPENREHQSFWSSTCASPARQAEGWLWPRLTGSACRLVDLTMGDARERMGSCSSGWCLRSADGFSCGPRESRSSEGVLNRVEEWRDELRAGFVCQAPPHVGVVWQRADASTVRRRAWCPA
eukprot:3550904-Amphidinium_carterae.2